MFGIKKKHSLKDRIKSLFKSDISKSLKKELYRKSVHVSSLWIPVFIYFVNPQISFMLFSTLFVLDVILEYGNYKKWYIVRVTYGRLFSKMLRNKETKKDKFEVVGSAYVLLAAAVASIVFSKEVAAVSLVVMLISDTCAAIAGKIYGTRKLRVNKSIEGTFAFFASAILIMLIFNPLLPVTYSSIIACIAATLAEMYEDKVNIDDNFSIPVVVGLVLTFI